MALIKCPDCGGQVSTAAPACPHCGRPVTESAAPSASPQVHGRGEGLFLKSMNLGCLFFVLIVAVGFLVIVFADNSTENSVSVGANIGSATAPATPTLSDSQRLALKWTYRSSDDAM